MTGKPCERCQKPAVKGERYCAAHRGEVLREMRLAGYLTPPPPDPPPLTRDERRPYFAAAGEYQHLTTRQPFTAIPVIGDLADRLT